MLNSVIPQYYGTFTGVIFSLILVSKQYISTTKIPFVGNIISVTFHRITPFRFGLGPAVQFPKFHRKRLCSAIAGLYHAAGSQRIFVAGNKMRRTLPVLRNAI